MKLASQDLSDFQVKCEKWIKYNKVNRFMLKFKEEDVKELFRRFGERSLESEFFSTLYGSESLTKKLLNFLNVEI